MRVGNSLRNNVALLVVMAESFCFGVCVRFYSGFCCFLCWMLRVTRSLGASGSNSLLGKSLPLSLTRFPRRVRGKLCLSATSARSIESGSIIMVGACNGIGSVRKQQQQRQQMGRVSRAGSFRSDRLNRVQCCARTGKSGFGVLHRTSALSPHRKRLESRRLES